MDASKYLYFIFLKSCVFFYHIKKLFVDRTKPALIVHTLNKSHCLINRTVTGIPLVAVHTTNPNPNPNQSNW